MRKNTNLIFFLSFCLVFMPKAKAQKQLTIKDYSTVVIGAQQFDAFLPLLNGKKVGVITNNTGLVGKVSIVDTLISLNVLVKKIFGPEHGFRGNTEAGEHIASDTDFKTGLPVVSLYGSNKKPKPEQLLDLDILIYDIQDIGTRFYTYISTLTYVMEACAENKKPLIVLDRPNPNGFYIDGPVLKPEFKSFLGLHNVPIVYGMTTGEYAKMVNGEGWLKNKLKCELTVITLKNYNRKCSYSLPNKPSPNIPNEKAVILYPSLGLFEGTIMSLGRGTEFPFQVIGHPNYGDSSFLFTPKASALSAQPKYLNQTCKGLDLRQSHYTPNHPLQINISWLIELYTKMKRDDFFDKNFNFHAGNNVLLQQIKTGKTEIQIRKTWQRDIELFKKTRKKYLLYADF